MHYYYTTMADSIDKKLAPNDSGDVSGVGGCGGCDVLEVAVSGNGCGRCW